MAQEVFDGFDHTHYKDEVTERWGAEASESSDAWWRSLPDADKEDFGHQHLDIAADYGRAMAAGRRADSDVVQAIVHRHYGWVALGWQGREPSAAAFTGLGEMYVADPRFAQNYDRHGEGVAAFVCDAMTVYAERNLRATTA